jgi:hypothetical protein
MSKTLPWGFGHLRESFEVFERSTASGRTATVRPPSERSAVGGEVFQLPKIVRKNLVNSIAYLYTFVQTAFLAGENSQFDHVLA